MTLELTRYLAALWGKSALTCQQCSFSHNSLIAHLLAVAATAAELFEYPAIKRQWQPLLGNDAKPFLVLIAALHDVGKLHPYFQLRVGRLEQEITFDWWESDRRRRQQADNYFHGPQGFERLARLLGGWVATKTAPADAALFESLLHAACGHHGFYPRNEPAEVEPDELSSSEQATLELIEWLWRLLIADRPAHFSAISARDSLAVTHWFAGWVVLADWIGSDSDRFRPVTCDALAAMADPANELRALLHEYRTVAKKRLREIGLFVSADRGSAADYAARLAADLNRKGFSLNPMQNWAESVEIKAGGGSLTLCEVPMGAGKTEFACILAGRMIACEQAQGIVFALPTQASANQLHGRIDKTFSQPLFGKEAILAHGSSRWREVNPGATGEQGNDSRNQLLEWVNDANKRAFLAPVSVVTVDQIELAVLNCKHSFLRAAALARQVVIIDEIHAYDAYMTKLLDSVLTFLARHRTPVILLSATLPQHIRMRYLRAYLAGRGETIDRLEMAPYPRITHYDGSAVLPPVHLSGQPAPLRQVTLKTLFREAVTEHVLRFVEQGQCVCIICNTVKSAVAFYQELQSQHEKTALFHARFTQVHRNRWEREVLERFDANSTREQREGWILVATQVVEQSLDIDFDCMVSELAPVDLLLQRMGRLQRHRRTWRDIDPLLLVIVPESEEDESEWFQGTQLVYDEKDITLLKTMEWLEDLDAPLQLPSGIGEAVDAVYDRNENNLIEHLKKRWASDRCFDFDCENSLRHQVAALEPCGETRLGDPTYRLLITFREDDALFLLGEQGQAIPLPLMLQSPAQLDAKHLEVTRLHTVKVTDYQPDADHSLFKRLKNSAFKSPAASSPTLSDELKKALPYDYLLIGSRDGARVTFDAGTGIDLHYDVVTGFCATPL